MRIKDIKYRRRFKNKINMRKHEQEHYDRVEIQALREATRADWNQKTLHGIPRNLRTAKNFQQVIDMQNSLSQGHKTILHEDAHSPLFQHFEQKAKNQVKV